MARLRGRVRAAASWAREGQRVYRRQPVSFFRNHVAGELAHAEALAGHAPEALAALADADRNRVDTEAQLQPWIELARPWVAVADGATERGVELALAAAAYARGQDAAADAHRRTGRVTDRRRLRGRAALLLDRCEGAQTPLVRPLHPDH